MYKRDLITTEIEKLAQILAKIMGLKLENKLVEAEVLLSQTLENSFGLPIELIFDADLSPFENWIITNTLGAEKLDSLSEFLYYELGVSENNNKLIAPKLNMIYEHLSNKHKVVHLVNLHRQKTIQQYL